MDPRIHIRIWLKIFWIHNTASYPTIFERCCMNFEHFKKLFDPMKLDQTISIFKELLARLAAKPWFYSSLAQVSHFGVDICGYSFIGQFWWACRLYWPWHASTFCLISKSKKKRFGSRRQQWHKIGRVCKVDKVLQVRRKYGVEQQK